MSRNERFFERPSPRNGLQSVTDNFAVEPIFLFSLASLRARAKAVLALYVQTLTQIHSGTLLCISVLDVLKPKGMGGEGGRWASQYYIWALVVPRAWLCVSRTPKMRLENPLHLQFQSKNFSFLRVPILIHPFLLSLFYFNCECYFCYNYYYCCFLFLEVTSYTSSLGFEASHTPRRKEPLSVEIFISLELLIYFLLLYKFFIYVIVVGLNVDGLGIPEHILL